MQNKYRRLLKDTGIFAIGSLGSKLILFFLVPLYTNFMSREEYGIAELVTSFSQLLIPVASVMIGNAVIRFGMKHDEKPENVAAASMFILLISIPVSIILVLLSGLYNAISPWKIYLLMIVIFSNFSEVERAYLKVKDRNGTFALLGILQTAVMAGTNVILLTVLHAGVKGYLMANIIAVAFTAVTAFFCSGIYGDLKKSQLDPALIKGMVIFSAPLILTNIGWVVVHSSDRIMLEILVGASALGIYTAAAKVPALINVVISMFNQAWNLSSIREFESSDDSSFYSRSFDAFTVAVFGAAIIVTAVVKPFMSIYVGAEFRESWVFVPFLISAAVFSGISAILGTLYSAVRQTKNDMWTMLLCAVVNIIVNYFGIIVFGTWGAVLGTVSAYFVVSIVRIIDIRRYLAIQYQYRRLIINTVLMLGQALAVSADKYAIPVSIVAILLFILNNVTMIRALLKRGK